MNWSVATLSLDLSWPVHFGMYDPHMSGQSIASRECLFFDTQMTSDLHLAVVVDGIFVPCQIVRTRENRVAWFPSGRVDALALVGALLRIAHSNCLGWSSVTMVGTQVRVVNWSGRGARRLLSMHFTLMPLEPGSRVETLTAVVERASICANICRSIARTSNWLAL